MRFDGKVALVTGSSRGLGKSTLLRLAAEGADVVVHYKKNADLAEEVAAEARHMGRRALTVAADLESPEAISALFDQVREEYGRLDILVASAAATAFKPLLELKPHHVDRTLGMVVRGFVLLVQGAVPLMHDGGRIVAVSGVDAIRYMPGHGLLGAAKAALQSLVRDFAVELADYHVNVNAVCLGGFVSDSSQFYGGDQYEFLRQAFTKMSTRQRFGTVDDMADGLLFLCSDAADYIAGQTLVIDGGITLPLGDLRPINEAKR